MYSRLVVGIVLGLFLMIAGCSSERREYESAKKSNSIPAYEQFLEKYPQSEFASQARGELEQLLHPATSFGTLVRLERSTTIPFKVLILTLNGLKSSEEEESAGAGKTFIVLHFEGERQRALDEEMLTLKSVTESGMLLQVYDSLYVQDAAVTHYPDGILSTEETTCRLAYQVPEDATGLTWFDGTAHISLDVLLQRAKQN